jgi:ribosome-associated protein
MNKELVDNESQILANTIVKGMQENKAEDIVILDLREVNNAVCDFFIICSGESSTQVDGISKSVTRYARKEIGEKPWNIEGKSSFEWVLLDYFSVVAHIFHKEKRTFFDLEDLWADAKRINIPNLN